MTATVHTWATGTARRWLAALAGLVLLAAGAASAAENAGKPSLKTAIFVENRAGDLFKDKVAVLEDLLTSRVAGRGFTLLSRQTVTDALKKEEGGTALDQRLAEQSSALRLAQSLGADFILMASITSYGSEKKSFKDENVDTVNLTHTLRVGARILDAGEGGALTGDTVKASRTFRFTANSATESGEVLNELLDDAAQQLAARLPDKRKDITVDAAKPKLVDVTIACGMTDLAQLPLSVPDLRVAEDGTVARGASPLPVQLIDVTVEVNGTVMGSAPGAFKVPPGLNKLRLTREGFATWERTVNFVPGQKLNVALQMSEAGYRRWQDNTRFLQDMETGRKLADANVKAIEGFAQMLRQSGYKVDAKSDVQIRGKSLFDGAVIKQTIK